MEMLARSVAAFRVATRLASAPTIRCRAAVGGSAALRMRHTPRGCRSADLVGVQTNFRLPPVPTMRRAQQCRYFARSLPPSKRHSRLTIVRRGCDLSRIAEIHGEAMYTAPDSASAAALRDTNCQCAGSRGKAPRPFLLGGVRGDVLFPRKENIPPCRIPTRCGAPSHPTVRQYEPPPCTSDTPTQGSRNTAPSRRRSCRRPRSRRPGRLPFRPR